MGNVASQDKQQCSVHWHISQTDHPKHGSCRAAVLTSLTHCDRIHADKGNTGAPVAAPNHTKCTKDNKIPIYDKRYNDYYCCGPLPTKTVPSAPVHIIERTQVYHNKKYKDDKCHVDAPSPHMSKNSPIANDTKWLHGHCTHPVK